VQIQLREEGARAACGAVAVLSGATASYFFLPSSRLRNSMGVCPLPTDPSAEQPPAAKEVTAFVFIVFWVYFVFMNAGITTTE